MTTMTEPEWDTETRELAIAYSTWDRCPNCGGPAYLCQDPSFEFAWDVPPPVRCHRTTALTLAQRKVTEETNPVPQALIWRTVLKAR